MDVLQYWQPAIDWQRFKQGPIRDDMWERFKQVVQLCHAFKHWQSAAETERQMPPPLYAESAYMRRKRKSEWSGRVEVCKGHMLRSAYLTADKMAGMSFLISNADEGKSDWTLWHALWLALRYQPSHEHTRCKAAAFDEFDAVAELRDPIPDIVNRWLVAGGYGATLK